MTRNHEVGVGQADTTTGSGEAGEFVRLPDPDGSRLWALFGKKVASIHHADEEVLAKSGLHSPRVPHPILPVAGCEEPPHSSPFQRAMMNAGRGRKNRRRLPTGDGQVKAELEAVAFVAKPKAAPKPPPLVLVWHREGRYHVPRLVPAPGWESGQAQLSGYKPPTVRMGAGKSPRRQNRSRAAPMMRY